MTLAVAYWLSARPRPPRSEASARRAGQFLRISSRLPRGFSELGVSPETVRRDLKELERRGMLRRRLRAKRAIGAAAAALVVPGQTVVTGVSRAISPGRVSGPWDLFTRADPDAGDVVIGLTGG